MDRMERLDKRNEELKKQFTQLAKMFENDDMEFDITALDKFGEDIKKATEELKKDFNLK